MYNTITVQLYIQKILNMEFFNYKLTTIHCFQLVKVKFNPTVE